MFFRGNSEQYFVNILKVVLKPAFAHCRSAETKQMITSFFYPQRGRVLIFDSFYKDRLYELSVS